MFLVSEAGIQKLERYSKLALNRSIGEVLAGITIALLWISLVVLVALLAFVQGDSMHGPLVIGAEITLGLAVMVALFAYIIRASKKRALKRSKDRGTGRSW